MVRVLRFLMAAALLLPALLAAQPPTGQAQQEHRLRFQNASSRNVQKVAIGTAEFSGVAPGAVTDYKAIAPGNLRIKGRFDGQGNVYIDGAVFVKYGAYKDWTVVLDDSRVFSIVDDTAAALPAPPEQQAVDAQQQYGAPSLLRFANNFDGRVVMVSIGPVSFRDVAAGQTTASQPIYPGAYQIVGEIEGYGPGSIKGSAVIDAGGNKRYTETLTPQGLFVLTEEY